MAKFLMVSPEKCTGCRTCELACSFNKEQEFNPVQSRVNVLTWQDLPIPRMCLQCEDPECQKACPVGAISRSEETKALLVDQDVCIRCQQCVAACPYGGIAYDKIFDRVIKCDLCDGDPQCAKFCPSGAITFCEIAEENETDRKAMADIFHKLAKGGL